MAKSDQLKNAACGSRFYVKESATELFQADASVGHCEAGAPENLTTCTG